MKKFLMLAAAAAAVSATPAMAATNSATYDVKASVSAFCTALTSSSTALDFGSLDSFINADGTLGTNSLSKNVQQTNVVCNGAGTTITVTPTAMTNTNSALTDTSQFTKTINYTTTVSLAGSSVTVDSLPHNVGALNGTLSVTASNLSPAGGLALYAGSYAGTIVVTLTPSA